MKAEFTVKVGGHDIQVVEAPTTDMLHDYLGTWATETNRITLRKNLPPHRRVEVFLHELTHIILLAQGLEEGKEEREGAAWDPPAWGLAPVASEEEREAEPRQEPDEEREEREGRSHREEEEAEEGTGPR